MTDIYEILKEERKEGDYIPIRFDPVMKKIWGDINHPERSAFLLSKILDMPYELILNHIEIIESEKRKKNISEKGTKNDILIKVTIPEEEMLKVNIEMNNKLKYSKTITNRNIKYIFEIFIGNIQIEKKYNMLTPTIQINFNTYPINSNKIINEFYISDDSNYHLTEDFKIITIDIVKCYQIYYNEDINKYDERTREIIKIGALMVETKRDKFSKCLEDIDMEESIKKDIGKTMDTMSEDEEILDLWDYEWDREYLEKGYINEIKEDYLKQGQKEGIKKGIKQGINQRNIEIAKNLLDKNVDLNTIIESTGLTKEELEKL